MSKSLALLLAARLGLGLTYSLLVPVWESYDEDGHFAYARYLAQHRTLALRPGDPEADKVWEKFQPPLYYILVALLIAGFDLGETFEEPPRNPYFAAGNAGVNYALHPQPLDEIARQTALAVRVGRALSVVVCTIGVGFVHRAATRIWPAESSTAWAATCVYALWPQFLFVGSMLTNDALVTALSAAAIYFAVVLATDGFHLGHALLLAGAVSAGLLTKLNAVALIPVAGLALGLSIVPARRRPNRPRPARWWFGLAILALLVVAALWLLSSLEFVSGQVFQAAILADFARNLGQGTQPSGSNLVSAALPYAFRTFLASFGWGNLETFPWFYKLWTMGAALAVVGWILSLMRRYASRLKSSPRWLISQARAGRSTRDEPLIVVTLFGLHVVTLLALTLALAIARQSVFLVPGRYLLPALPAVVFLLFAGWRGLLPSSTRLRLAVWKGLSLGLVIVGWLTPFTILAAAYAKPRALTAGAAAAGMPLAISFGNSIELTGYQEAEPVAPGEDLKVELCWQATAPVVENYSIFLEVVGPDGQGYGRLETYPGRGNYPTSLWAVSVPFCEQYRFNVGAGIPAPALASLRVSLLDGVLGPKLPMSDRLGEVLPGDAVAIPLRVRIDPRNVPRLSQSVQYRFGAGIVLSGYELTPLPDLTGQPGVRVVLRWEAGESMVKDYVVFVHLRDTPQTAYAQGDSQPRGGAYPTGLWQAGEALLDEHALYFPEDTLTPPLDLYVGLYNVETAERLPAFDAQSNPIPNGEVILARGLVFPLVP